MTSPDDPTASPFDATETASQTKQQTLRNGEGNIVEDKALSTPKQSESHEFADKRNRAEAYRGRLEEFWLAAHPDSSNAEIPGEQDVFLRAMMRVSREDLAILIDDEEVLLPKSPAIDVVEGVIAGSPQDVDLEVAELISGNPSQAELVRFMQSSIGPTIERMERAKEGTPETRTDIVARVLFVLRDLPSAAELGCELYRHLQSQTERSEGFYQTVVNMAVIVSAGGPDSATEAMFLYHAALVGFRDIFDEQRLAAGGASGNEVSRNLVSISAASLARILGRRLREMDADSRVQALPVLRDLRTISAVTCSVSAFEGSEPGAVAAALRLPTAQPVESLTVLMDMTEMVDTWGFGNIEVSELEASGGVSAAAAGNILRGVDLLYNAGISLRSYKEVPDGKAASFLMARMLINLAGLRLAIAAGEDLYESLVGLDGCDCAVNFMGTYVDYKSAGDPDVVASLQPLAIEIAHLVKWPMMQRAKRRADLARIERSAKSLGITVDPRSTFPGLRPSLQRAIEALRSSFGLESPAVNDLIVDTAYLIGDIYSSVLVVEDAGKMRSIVADLVSERNVAMRVLFERYGVYAATAEGGVGLGPAVVAGAVTEADWQQVVERLTDPVTSVAGAIADFAG